MSAVVLGDPGALVLNVDVDNALVAMLKAWLPTYLRVTADERGLTLPVPHGASYNNPVDMSEWTDRAFPGVMVATSKTQGTPKRHATGVYEMAWLATIAAVVRGTSGPTTRQRASLYEGAIRRALGHTTVLTGQDLIHKLRWNGGTEVRPVASISRAGRYLAAGMTTFLVTTDRAFQDSAGIQVPIPDPSQPTVPTFVPVGTITEIDVTIENEVDSGQTPSTDTQHITSGG